MLLVDVRYVVLDTSHGEPTRANHVMHAGSSMVSDVSSPKLPEHRRNHSSISDSSDASTVGLLSPLTSPGRQPSAVAPKGLTTPRACSNGCGWTAFQKFSTCCTHCRPGGGKHARDCSTKNQRLAGALCTSASASASSAAPWIEREIDPHDGMAPLDAVGGWLQGAADADIRQSTSASCPWRQTSDEELWAA